MSYESHAVQPLKVQNASNVHDLRIYIRVQLHAETGGLRASAAHERVLQAAAMQGVRTMAGMLAKCSCEPSGCANGALMVGVSAGGPACAASKSASSCAGVTSRAPPDRNA